MERAPDKKALIVLQGTAKLSGTIGVCMR